MKTAHAKEITVADLDTKYVLVPREPNGKMIAAAFSRDTTGETDLYASIYRAMIAAAPALPSTSEEVAGMVKELVGHVESIDYANKSSPPPSPNLQSFARVSQDLARRAATLLEALDAKVRTVWNEAIEAAATAAHNDSCGACRSYGDRRDLIRALRSPDD